ncbi:hypothetical protein J1605_019142 [Eschrichtius robustus]|uniref:Uncharacterized protein n=1 Tax=Eschrichtius robustus TaxID=9764 RepID=A0AB34HNS2_ESCRO|nr:hypothetical protein J1605_019142 [Eschrichtius robustus]
MQGLLDFESPEDLEMDPGDLEGGSAKNGPERTKDSAFSDDLQQALAMMEDLIKSCELAVDLAAVTGCPLMTLSIRQLGRGSNRKFEIANQNGLEKYILQVKFMPSP